MEERSQRIVRAAIELAEKGGFEGVRLRDVAAHAGVALGTLYRRFRSKEELLLAALELQVAALERRMAREPARGDTPLDRITDLFTYATDGMCSRPHLARACLRSVVAGGPELSTRVVGFHTRIEGLVVSALRGGAGAEAAEEIEERLGRALVRVWFAALTGWASGLHGRDRVVAETRSAGDLMLASGAAACRPRGEVFESPLTERASREEGRHEDRRRL